MGSRRVGDGVIVVLGGSVIHAGALEVVSRANGVLLLQRGTTQRVSLLSQSDKGWRPGARVTVLDVATGREHLANGRTHVVCYAEAPEHCVFCQADGRIVEENELAFAIEDPAARAVEKSASRRVQFIMRGSRVLRSTRSLQPHCVLRRSSWPGDVHDPRGGVRLHVDHVRPRAKGGLT